MTISIDLIKQLREMTLAPLGDCKEALVEANGDLTQAQDILKKKGAIKADKKAGRETNNGVIKFISKNNALVGVKLLCETDFVAKNEAFGQLVDQLLDVVADHTGDINPDSIPSDIIESLQGLVKDQAVTIGEAMNIGYVIKKSGNVYVYNHMGNTLAAAVFYQGDESFAKDCALQVAAMDPSFISLDNVDADRIAQLRSEFEADESLMNKPENIRKQIIEGKVQKAVQDEILLEQVSIKDQSKKMKELMPASFVVQSFLRVSI